MSRIASRRLLSSSVEKEPRHFRIAQWVSACSEQVVVGRVVREDLIAFAGDRLRPVHITRRRERDERRVREGVQGVDGLRAKGGELTNGFDL